MASDPAKPEDNHRSGGSFARVVVSPWSEPVTARTGTAEGEQETMVSGAPGVVRPPVPPVVSSAWALNRTTFYMDVYHSGNPDEQYQVRMTLSDRPGEAHEWEELDRDLGALLVEAARRMMDWMERPRG